MTPVIITTRPKLAALGAGALFIGDLFPTWQPAAGSGWDDWGIAAGALALVVLWLITARIERPRAAVVAATGLLAATGLGLNNGGTRWPAWLGLALAVLTLAACLEAYRTAPRPATTRPGGVTPPHAV